MTSRISAFLCAAILVTGLSACSGEIKKEASYPTKPEAGTKTTAYSDEKRDTIWGKGKSGADVLFGDKKEEEWNDLDWHLKIANYCIIVC